MADCLAMPMHDIIDNIEEFVVFVHPPTVSSKSQLRSLSTIAVSNINNVT